MKPNTHTGLPKVKISTEIGRWAVDWTNYTLVHQDGCGYYIDLDELTSTRRVLEALFTLCGKCFITGEDLGQVTRIMWEIFDDAFCEGHTEDKTYTVAEVRKRVKKALGEV